MIRALEDEDRIVRIAALEPVAAFGEKAMAAVSILETWLSSDDEFSTVSAAGHILMIDRSRADDMVPVLLEALESDNGIIRRHAEWLLGELGVSAQRDEKFHRRGQSRDAELGTNPSRYKTLYLSLRSRFSMVYGQ